MLSPAERPPDLEHVRPLETIRRPLLEALDLVLAEDVTSPIDLPAWDNSAMDGYAVRSADVTGASSERPVALRVVETVPAGRFPERALGLGEVTRISPARRSPGADGVIRQEDTEPLPTGAWRCATTGTTDATCGTGARTSGRRRGARPGSGARTGAARVLASIAHGTPLVHRPPRVAFMGSGDEIVDLDRADEILAGRKIATSNSYTLHGMIAVPRDAAGPRRGAGHQGQPARAPRGSARRGPAHHHRGRERGRARPGARRAQRARLRHEAVAHPYAPGGAARLRLLDGRPWIGLPGNPVSTMVTFELFVRPAIRRMLGRPGVPAHGRRVRGGADHPGTKLRITCGRSSPLRRDGALVARLTGPQGSGILTSMARANALLIVPEDRPAVAVGEVLQALVLDDPHHVAEAPF